LGPTGGYLIGFMAASFLVGKILEKESRNLFKITASFLIGNVILYTLGTLWLMLIYRISFVNAILIGVLPFFTIELAKIFLAAVVYRSYSHRSKALLP
ncbi:MAG: biotin transporter BioY, partial [Candidatus Omnitrophica bacterium]|nr:biotin transporter BioY [Candidatus Omnitrophota bacterium]